MNAKMEHNNILYDISELTTNTSIHVSVIGIAFGSIISKRQYILGVTSCVYIYIV